MRYPGRFLKNRTPPTVDRRGVPVGLSILLLVVIVVIVVLFWRRRSEVSTILIDEKSKNKVILILYKKNLIIFGIFFQKSTARSVISMVKHRIWGLCYIDGA